MSSHKNNKLDQLASLKSYHAIFDLMPESLMLIDREGYVLDANNKLMEWVGFSKKEILSKNIVDLPCLTVNSRKFAGENLKKRTAGLDVPPYDLEFAAKNGEKRFGVIRGAIIHNDLGEIVSIVLMISDTTKQHQMEDALFMSEEKFDLLFNDSPDIIGIIDDANKFVNLNKKFASYCAVSKSLIGKNSKSITECQLLSKESTNKMQEVIANILKNNQWETQILLEGEKKEDQQRFYLLIPVPFKRNGNIQAVLIILKDITEQKIAENKIRESEARYRLIADNTSEFLSVLDFSDNPTYKFVNSAYIRNLGFSKDELIGKPVLDFAHPDDKHLIEDIFKKYRQKIKNNKQLGKKFEPGTERLEYRRADKNGEWHYVETVVNLAGNDLVVISQDITKRKMIENMKTEFLSIASHQLRTPLTDIKWSADILQKRKYGPLNDKQAHLIDKIANTNERLVNLVNNLLDVSHIETGEKSNTVKSKVNIYKIFEDVICENISLINELKLKVDNLIPKNMLVMADEMKIKQVVDNIISNAVKYSFEKKCLLIKVKQEKDRLIFSIKNSGFGIPLDQQDHIFEKFFRADNVMKKHATGTGLGLYIAKSFIENHGGNVWFKSILNKNTTFYFSLPQ